MLRIVLILLAGVLLGANAVYYLMTRDGGRPADVITVAQAPTPAETDLSSAPPTAASAPASPSTVPAAPVATPPLPGAALPAATPPPAVPGRGGLIVPVQGIAASQLSNTFDDTRGTDRVHEALDIMAPRGTPVLAVADGKVEKLFNSDQGGLTVYQFEPTGRFAYYYAHLDRYAPGVVEGKPVRQGELIGYVGSTGNAAEDTPHLHFAIFVLGPEKQWWKGTAINPYPLLR